MYTSKSYRFIALSLALLIAVSSIGMSVSVHYCQGNLSGVSLLPKGEKALCHDTKAATTKQSCCKSDNSDDKPCCSDEESIISLDFDSPGITDVILSDLESAKTPPITLNLIEVLIAPITSFTGLDPPEATCLSGSDIRIIYASFLC